MFHGLIFLVFPSKNLKRQGATIIMRNKQIPPGTASSMATQTPGQAENWVVVVVICLFEACWL